MVQRDPELLENDTDKIRKLLLDNALARSKAPDKEIAGAASLASAQLYLSFPAAALIKDQAENYFNALICAGQVYSNKGAIYEAIILLAQAFKLKEKSRGVEWKDAHLLKARQTLAGLYEQVELWDYSARLRVDLLKLLPEKDKAAEKVRLDKAEQNRTQQVYLYDAHRKYLKILQDYAQTSSELVQATGMTHFEELIAKEQKALAYAG